MNMKITIPYDNPVRLASAQLEELDYRELDRAYSSQGRKLTAKIRLQCSNCCEQRLYYRRCSFPEPDGQWTLRPFLGRLGQQHGKRYRDVVTDAGYESLDNYLYLEDNGQISFIKPINYEAQKAKKFRQQIGRRENMQYDEQEDCYVCAAGSKLAFHRESTQRNRQGYFPTTVYYRCEDCTGCPYREACCKAKDNAAKELTFKTDLLRLGGLSRQNIETERGIALRVNRSIQVEGAFGVLKNDRKFKRFLTRGRTNISTELYLLCLGFNLNKLWAKCNAGRPQTHLFRVQKE